MQYVGPTCRALQKRIGEHYRRMKMPKPIDVFLYQHFKLTGHSPTDVLVQSVEKLTYDKIISSCYRFSKSSKDMKLKWITLLQTPFPLGFSDNFTTNVIFLKCLILTCFLAWKFEIINLDRIV